MARRQSQTSAAVHTEPASADAKTEVPPPHQGVYHPSAALRRNLNRQGERSARTAQHEDQPSSEFAVGYAPPLVCLIGAGLAVGAVSGLLELLVQAIQLRILHQVHWSTLVISRHAGWMVVLVATVLTPSLTALLMAPAFLWAARRKRQGAAASRLAWTWDLAGLILGALLMLGPIQSIHGLHPAAPVAVALGAGIQLRRLLVWKSPAWQRTAFWAGAIVVGLLPLFTLWRWHAARTVPERVAAAAAGGAPNLLWIVLDTLRADHMSVYGYHRATTPQLEAWAKLGITFDMARSPACWTLPSHLTMFTGLWPTQHGARVDRPYFGESPTLAEHLRGRGYATAGFVANVRMCNRAYGVARGFDTYADYPWNEEVSLKAALSNSALGSSVMEVARRLWLPAPDHYPFKFRVPGSAIAHQARAWLEQMGCHDGSARCGDGRPFFLFLNFFDAHGPYLPTATDKQKFWKGPIPPERLAAPKCGWEAQSACESAAPAEQPARRRELETVCRRLGDLYDDCVYEMDAAVGRLLDELRASGTLAETWIVIVSDHGEHFGEHNQFGHGSSLYNEATHVPLILIPPLGSEEESDDPTPSLRGRRIHAPVSTRNLARTLAELTGASTENPFPGQSLAGHWTGTEAPPFEPVFSQLVESRLGGDDFRAENLARIESVIDEDRVLIDSDSRFFELYDLSGDPRQQLNMVNQPTEQARLERLQRSLDRFRAEAGWPVR
jgi:arylsulfatase A-like enzyme